MPFINYVELNVPKASKSAEFYKAVFDWKLEAWGDDDYLVAQHGDEPGIDSALRTAPDGQPLTVAIITVPDIDASIAAVQAAGGSIVVEKFPIEGVGHAAYFKDPDGMIVGLHQTGDGS